MIPWPLILPVVAVCFVGWLITRRIPADHHIFFDLQHGVTIKHVAHLPDPTPYRARWKREKFVLHRPSYLEGKEKYVEKDREWRRTNVFLYDVYDEPPKAF
jgi:hypothetical protein